MGRKTTDRLVKIWLVNGQETWILIHIEVQSQPEADFAERMYIYNSRIYDRYHRKVLSLAVLADETQSWRPTQYRYEILGGETLLKFPTVKLLDYTAQTLAASNNPFAVVVSAHRETQKTSKDSDRRYREKLSIAKGLYRRGYQKRDILELFRLIDWMMTLPKSLEENFTREIYRYEEEQQMPYITSVERLGIEKGLKQGLEQGLEQGLKQGRQEGIIQKSREALINVLRERFEKIPDELVEAIALLEDETTLTDLLRQSISIESVAAFQAVVHSLAGDRES